MRLGRAAAARDTGGRGIARLGALLCAAVLAACSSAPVIPPPSEVPLSKDALDLLAKKGMQPGAPVYVRIFKDESELEIWKQRDDGRFYHFKTYPICNWSGELGPKIVEGDKQAPEGFYTVTKRQLYHAGRWPRSLLLNFPNVYDQAEARTGSDILIHGGCTSVGCFAMTNPVSDEVHRLTVAAIDAGQDNVPIHVFPFRMTEENVKSHASPAWASFWANLKEGYDAFEQTKRVPRVAVCNSRYTFAEAPGTASTGAVEACQTTIATIKDQNDWLDGVTPASPIVRPVRTAAADIPPPMRLGGSVADSSAEPQSGGLTGAPPSAGSATGAAGVVDPAPNAAPEAAAAPPAILCRWALPVCRRTSSLKAIQAARKAARFAIGLRLTILLPRSRAPAEGKQR